MERGGAVGVLSLFSSHEFAKVTLRMKKASVRVLQYNLPVKLVALDEGGYLATCQNLQGCLAEGDTASEAVSNIIDVAAKLIELHQENNLPLNLKSVKTAENADSLSFSLPLPLQLAV